MADCPKCRSDLGLKTSFALANLRSLRGVPPYGGFNYRLEYPCHRCGTKLTYRAEVAGLFAVLALLPLILFPLLPSFGLGSWAAYLMWVIVIVAYWAAIAVFFSRYARPMIANPPLEGDW